MVADPLPHLAAVDRNLRMNLEAQSHLPAVDLEYCDLVFLARKLALNS
jgi:hypothetical protein